MGFILNNREDYPEVVNKSDFKNIHPVVFDIS